MTKHLLLALSLFVVGCASESGGDDDPGPDPSCDTTYYADADGDGYGDATTTSCEQEAGYVARAGDCDDDTAAAHPDAIEVCDEIDNNCSGAIDEVTPQLPPTSGHLFYRDADGDGFGEGATAMRACTAPAGYVLSDTDCDDTAAAIHPNATEVCDSIDNDCDLDIDIADSSIDLSTAQTYYRDMDGDTYGGTLTMTACSRPSGYVDLMGDCDDNDTTTKPGGTELCDGRDNDCDGGIDGTAALPNRCAALVGTYSGAYTHLTQEKLGMTVINSVSCAGTGSSSLVLSRAFPLQGTYSCTYNGSLGGFDSAQPATLRANVTLTGAVTGTITHRYDTFPTLERTYTITGTLTGTTLTLSGTGTWLPHPMSAVPWQTSFTLNGSR